jgi:uncharacterized membrane protein YphA (DoxX/SURF4 family)
LPSGPGLKVSIFGLRVWTGIYFLSSAWYKLIQEGYTVGEKIGAFEQLYVKTVANAIDHPPEVLGFRLDFFADFLEHVMLPARGFFAPAILFFEAVLGICLVLGLGVRFIAFLGFLMMLAFSLAKAHPGASETDPVGVFLFTVHSSNWPVTLLLLAFVLIGAGRIWGLDTWLRAKAPGWLRWIG